jgi:hypothetical protein
VKVTVHTCPFPWLNVPGHPCARVIGALKAAGVEYDVVKNPQLRDKRAKVEELSGQRLLPLIQFEDGVIYREQSKDMVATIRSSRLAEKDAPASS